MGGSYCPISSVFNIFSLSLKNLFSSLISSIFSFSSFFLSGSFSPKFRSFSSISISLFSSMFVFLILYFFFISSIALLLSNSLFIIIFFSFLSSSILDKSGNFILILFIFPWPEISGPVWSTFNPFKSFNKSFPVRSLFDKTFFSILFLFLFD